VDTPAHSGFGLEVKVDLRTILDEADAELDITDKVEDIDPVVGAAIPQDTTHHGKNEDERSHDKALCKSRGLLTCIALIRKNKTIVNRSTPN